MKSLSTKSSSLKLQFVEDIEYFDGPMLALYQDEEDNLYLHYWCDMESTYSHRFLVLGTDSGSVSEYKKKNLSLRKLLLSHKKGSIYYRDLGMDEDPAIFQLEEFPAEYLPEEGCYYDP